MALRDELWVLRWDLLNNELDIDATARNPNFTDAIRADEQHDVLGVSDISTPDRVSFLSIIPVEPVRSRAWSVRPIPREWYTGPDRLILIHDPVHSVTYTLDEIQPLSRKRWRLSCTEIVGSAGRTFPAPS